MTSLDILLVLVALISVMNATVGGLLIFGGFYHTFRTARKKRDQTANALVPLFFISGLGLLVVGFLTFEVAWLDYAEAARLKK